MLGTVDVVLVTENADGHVRAGNSGQLDGARETLVTLGVIVLEADLELNGLCVTRRLARDVHHFGGLEAMLTEEVALLGVVGVVKKLLNVRTHSGDCDLRHLDSLPVEYLDSNGEDWRTDGVWDFKMDASRSKTGLKI